MKNNDTVFKEIVGYCEEILDRFDKIEKLTSESDFNKISNIIRYYQSNIFKLSTIDKVAKMASDIEVVIRVEEFENGSINEEVAITKEME